MNKIALSFQSMDRLTTYYKAVVEFEELTEGTLQFIVSIASDYRHFGKTQWVHITYENDFTDGYELAVYTADSFHFSTGELEHYIKEIYNDREIILGAMQNG